MTISSLFVRFAAPDCRPSRTMWSRSLLVSRPLRWLACGLIALLWTQVPGTARADDRWVYTVLPGDTLIGIARDLLRSPKDWRALQRLNRVDHPRLMATGRELQIPLEWLHPEASVAKVVARVGDVQLIRQGALGQDIESGASLRAGDRLNTGTDSSATIELVDGSLVLLAPQSQLTLNELFRLRGAGSSATVLELQQGSTESVIPAQAPRPRFEIRTPVMNLGVRGTEFRAHADPARQQARIEVTRGLVSADAARGWSATEVPAGFGVVGSSNGVGAPVALLEAPDLMSVPGRVERLPLSFAWAGANSASGWRAQVFDTQGRLWRDSRVDTSAAQWSELPDGLYKLRVRAVDRHGLEGMGRDAEFTLKARPEPPITMAPRADARHYGPSATWRWSQSNAAVTYRLQVAASEDFAAPVIDRAGLPGPDIELPLNPGRWWWRMSSVRADGDLGPWGDALSFEQRETPPPPSTLSPTLDKEFLSLRWSSRLPGDRYRIQVARDAQFTDLVVDRVETRPGVELPLPPPAQYWVRVRTMDADGEPGPWGATSNLEVPSQVSPWIWLGPVLLLLIAL